MDCNPQVAGSNPAGSTEQGPVAQPVEQERRFKTSSPRTRSCEGSGNAGVDYILSR